MLLTKMGERCFLFFFFGLFFLGGGQLIDTAG